MDHIRKKRSVKAGLPPGTPVPIGEGAESTKVRIIRYTEGHLSETEGAELDQLQIGAPDGTVTWIAVTGLADVGVIEKIGAAFQLHPLIIEDVVNTAQRPKMEPYGDSLFVVLKVFRCGDGKAPDTNQVCLVIGRGYLISIEERETGLFRPVLERIRNGKGRIRGMGAGFLAYSLVDAIGDSYFAVIEAIGEQIEAIEDRLVLNPKRDVAQAIHELRRHVLFCRHVLWPTREVVGAFERSAPADLVTPATAAYVRDIYDHLIQILDTIEIYRDMVSGLLDVYLSSMSNRLNEIMKVLTLIATIFMPLTFIAGVYGMNFRHMPELDWPYGYLAALIFMAAVAIVMILFFKKRKWF